jgi:subtilisin family serine protease
MKLPIFLFATLVLTTFVVQAKQPIRFNSKVGLSIQKEFAEGKDLVNAIVILKEQADLDGAEKINNREERLKFVYETLKENSNNHQKSLVQFLKQNNLKHKRYLIMNMVVVENATAGQVDVISKRADVKKVIADPVVKTPDLPVVEDGESFARKLKLGKFKAVGPNILSTGAPNIWNITKGEGIVIAGQDTGVQWDHPALKKSYRGYSNGKVTHDYSWHDSIKTDISGQSNPCGRDIEVPCDDNAHGTHTVGTIVGDDGGDNQIGMAPKAQWIACRNMDNGVGRPSTYIECFEFFLAPYPQKGNVFDDARPEYAPHVINNSWGCPKSELCEGDEIIPALEAMNKAGIMVVVSAGNEGPGCSTIQDPPAHHTDLTFSVGAHNHRDNKIAFFSSRGPSSFDGGVGPDVTAPGVSVYSAIPGNQYQGTMWSGTSMAGPHVVGQVALMWSANKAAITSGTRSLN